ncbi:MAG: glycoside hydrolase family 3 C-terminal domain-containing protein [Lachnospiraceae bacterium]|nr:glycoside hydrolase family 3 C-terminal domain-containing protein [Lachnospiraceae bacterium]
MILDYREYENTARKAVAEGVVLLKNKKKALPIAAGSNIAVFGRMQNHYYKSGTGSGGMVNVTKVWGIMDALRLEDIVINEAVSQFYREFDKSHPLDTGVGFGNEPWSQEEAAVPAELVRAAASESELALVIIARTAGEEQDYADAPGAYRLSAAEVEMLKTVREAFDKVAVILNVSAVIDMSDIEVVAPDAILYAWQGGEMGGLGLADVLMGRVSPSGKLVDSIVKDIKRAPAYENFGQDVDRDFYKEDIYVGYRYYETFDRDAVLYPFGFGLSYTTFYIEPIDADFSDTLAVGLSGCVIAKVTNTGRYAGKEVVQVYVREPQGKLGKSALKLVGYKKVTSLAPGGVQVVSINVEPYTYASFDDSGVTGHKNAYVLEAGTYKFYVGNSSRNLQEVGEFTLHKTRVIKQLTEQAAPTVSFERIRPEACATGYKIAYEDVPLATVIDTEEAHADRPECLSYTGDQGIKLVDVRDKKASMEEFLAQLSDEDLSCIIRGEGMGSPKVTPGTAAAFGGVSKSLREFGIPCGCCSDGPSGMRLDSGAKAFSLPNGTLLACTFSRSINTRLYRLLGTEMTYNKVDVLLGPGMNIHRHPLNGRNFEYFSEDPYVTGTIAGAQIAGLRQAGVTGTLKHFCANNREKNRHGMNSIISQRALREIYLKGFEMAVKQGANSVMTTYGALNGEWTNGRHDLLTNILRGEWGFKGIVMTDWWSNIGDVGGVVNKTNFARLVLSQNDFYAVCPDGGANTTGDNTLEELAAGNITRGQLVRSAYNICNFLMRTNAMRRMLGENIDISIEGRDMAGEDDKQAEVTYYDVEDGSEIDLKNVISYKGGSYVFGVNVLKRGCYYMDMVGSSELSELAQIPVAVFFQSIPGGTFTFNGTGGSDMTVTRKILFSAKYGVLRLNFITGGPDLKKIKFRFEKEVDNMLDWGEFSEYIYG